MIPRHIAFIMDGNGRWAQAHGMPRYEGYKHGLEALLRVAGRLEQRGVGAISVFALSTENLSRPKDELSAIFDAVIKFNKTYFGTLRINYFGDIDALSDDIADSVDDVERRTSINKGTSLNIALNYGAQTDIVHAAKLAADKGSFLEDEFLSSLSTAGLPPLDMVVRTGGERRLSNFMLYESAYAELMFMDKLWPDMTADDADAALAEFEKRVRKFGK